MPQRKSEIMIQHKWCVGVARACRGELKTYQFSLRGHADAYDIIFKNNVANV